MREIMCVFILQIDTRHVKLLQEMTAKSMTMWKCKDVETPGEPGRISDEWEELKCLIPRVEEKIGDQIRNVEYCENSNSHQNQMGFLQCSRCNPNEYTDYTY
jgi:hypothetical protein